MKRVAVILCGSGYLDGSEIRESVATLCALSKHGAQVHCYALNEKQAHVVNALTGEESPGESRNQLVEAARIARGKISPLEELQAHDWDAVILPGGFGAAKNLCNYAFKGLDGSVHPKVHRKLQDFFAAKKPIGAICIAPIIVAMAFPKQGFELTLGASASDGNDAARDAETLGHRHVACSAKQFHVDAKNKLVTTPAYMHDSAPLHEIFEGIEGLVKSVIQLA